MKFRISAAVLLVVVSAGCGKERSGEYADTPAADTFTADSTAPVDTAAVADTAAVDESGVEPVNTPGASSSDLPPHEKPTADAGETVVGRYRLVSVQGESLPVTIVAGPDCEFVMGDGELIIRDDGHFAIRTSTWERCDGERGDEQTHETEGSVLIDGARIRFEATYDSMFGSATGAVRGDEILIDTFASEGGEQEVEWRFRR